MLFGIELKKCRNWWKCQKFWNRNNNFHCTKKFEWIQSFYRTTQLKSLQKPSLAQHFHLKLFKFSIFCSQKLFLKINDSRLFNCLRTSRPTTWFLFSCTKPQLYYMIWCVCSYANDDPLSFHRRQWYGGLEHNLKELINNPFPSYSLQSSLIL